MNNEKNLKMSQFKSRCSSLGKIMVGASFEPLPLTDVQKRDLQILLDKEKLTEIQAKTRNDLIAKRDIVPTPKLSDGAKTHIEELWYENKFSFRKTFTNKFVQKGNVLETHSLSELSKLLGVRCFKNIRNFQNDFITGTPDVLLRQFKTTIDAKNVYYPDGLKLFKSDKDETNLYTWQIHGYDWLLEHHTGYVIRMLMTPPENLIEKEIYTAWKSINQDPDEYPSDEFRNDIKNQFDFENKMPFNERYTFTKIESTQKHFDLIKTMVTLADDYWNELDEKFENRKVLILPNKPNL